MKTLFLAVSKIDLFSSYCISDSRCRFEKLVGRLTYYLQATKTSEEALRLFIFFILYFFTPKPLKLKGGAPRKLKEEGETSLRFFAFPGPINIHEFLAFAKIRGKYQNVLCDYGQSNFMIAVQLTQDLSKGWMVVHAKFQKIL